MRRCCINLKISPDSYAIEQEIYAKGLIRGIAQALCSKAMPTPLPGNLCLMRH